MRKENMKEELFAFVKDNTFKKTDGLTSDTLLFSEGIFDSMGFVLLLDFLESNFEVTADDSDLVEENFESIDAILEFILKKNPSLVEG